MGNIINKILQPVGLKLSRYPTGDLKRRLQIVNTFGFNKIFDVGASTGNYALLMRRLGFNGDIISFEPRKDAFNEMKKKSWGGGKNWWTIVNSALGNEDGTAEINIAGNLDSSSLLAIKNMHLDSAPESAYIGKEVIALSKLDTVFNSYYKENDSIFLKIDTQGFEKDVLDGAENSLSKIAGIQLEMSLVSLYEGDLLLVEMINYLNQKGYTLYSLENGFSDSHSGRLLQVDGIFINEKKVANSNIQ